MKLSGKRALVTGGSRGIGAAIAKRLAADGADVVITYAGNTTAAESVVAAIAESGGKGKAIQADAADAAAVRAAVDSAAEFLGGIDILVHNAGIGVFNAVDVDTIDNYERTFGVNVAGVFAGTVAAVPHIVDGGRIIIIGSVVGDTAGFPGGAVYAASKAAVAAFARGWAYDLGARNILVNAVQPGPIDTDLNPADGELAGMMLPKIALGRYGRPDEVASVVSFLASEDASYITGAAIDVGGGIFV